MTGALPPISEPAWQAEFEKYKTIPQFQLNKGMTLSDFKTIFWWEWGHRLLGRLIGAVFLLPFLFFLWRGWVEPALRGRLWGIFALGALQGAIGWWMVSSGLTERVSVSQYRLATHMTLACVIVLLCWRTRLRWPVIIAMTAFVALVGLSRIYLGVHYPSDILAGWAAAIAWTYAVYALVFRTGARPFGVGTP